MYKNIQKYTKLKELKCNFGSDFQMVCFCVYVVH